MKKRIIEKIKEAPRSPGVYMFYRKDKPLYVGKASNLRSRLKSYLKITDHKIQSLNEETTRLTYIVLRSDIEALLEESRLIKGLKPKYNVLMRDDKSYLYVAFTKEAFPKVLVMHKNPKAKNIKLKVEKIGPFTDSGSLRLVLKLLRRRFPYCTCSQTHLRECLNAQIGKCLGACCQKTGAIANNANLEQNNANKKIYRKNINSIKMVLRGKGKQLLKSLKDPNERAALETIFEHRPYAEQPKPKKFSEETITKVEAYDMSNFAGKEAVGALTALVKRDGVWMSDKNSYRKFKIKAAPTRDDPRMMFEVVSRRLNHPEWPYPDMIIIDGGITQYNAAMKAAAANPLAKDIKIISFAKPEQKIIGLENSSEELKTLVKQAIYQTHNFVVRYHRQVRRKEFLK